MKFDYFTYKNYSIAIVSYSFYSISGDILVADIWFAWLCYDAMVCRKTYMSLRNMNCRFVVKGQLSLREQYKA